jgi:hypothetical protein
MSEICQSSARACTRKGADVCFSRLSRNFLLNQSIAGFDPKRTTSRRSGTTAHAVFGAAVAAKVRGAVSGWRAFPNLQDCEVLHSAQSWSGRQCGLKGFSHDRIRKAPHNGRRGHPDGWSGHPRCAGLLGRAVTENHGYAIQAIRYSLRAACVN